MIEIKSPSTLNEIVESFNDLHNQSTRYWNLYQTEQFFAKLEDAWSPADNVRHLNKSNQPLILALSLPKLLIRLMFGKPSSSSLSYDKLKEKYLSVLAAGGKAGKFAPKERKETNLEDFRSKIMLEREEIFQKLIATIKKLPEDSLDKYNLPHPLLGKLTVREMLYFTVYHNQHHILVVERRKKALQK